MSLSGASLGMKVALVVIVALSSGLVGVGLASPGSAPRRAAHRYVAHLDALARARFRPERGRAIASCQLAGLLALAAVHVGAGLPYAPFWYGAVIVGPVVVVRRLVAERIQKIEEQVDGFVLSYANALKVVPSPAAALEAAVVVLPQPTREEVLRVLKEVRVGSTLEDALLAMSARVKSRWVDMAFSAVLVGLKVGGNLPTVLERTAATIREMNRLAGVVRSKTGEGRAQLWVLAIAPGAFVFLFDRARPGYFEPLQSSLVGQLALVAAAVFWLASLLVARKVLAVDV